MIWAKAGAAAVATAAAMRVLLRIFAFPQLTAFYSNQGVERIDDEGDVGALTNLARLARQNGPVQLWYTLGIRWVDSRTR